MAGIFQNSWRGAAAEADAIGEQQLKRTQSRAALAAESGRKRRAAAEADANGEQQLKRIERQSRREHSSSS